MPAPANPIMQTMHINTSVPKYGCLKNGKLPTYRNFMNQTRKNISDPVIHIGGANNVSNQNHPPSVLQAAKDIQSAHPLTIGGAKSEAVEQRINDSINLSLIHI